MMRGAAVFFWGALLACGMAGAQPLQLYGSVGKAPVFLDLSYNGDILSGWYFYLKVGKQLRLEGKLDQKGSFQIEEFTADTNAHTGTFTGHRRDGHWTGTWRGGRKALPLVLDELRSRLADIDGHYRCTAVRHDEEFGIATSEKLDLRLAKGRVKALAISRRERSDNDEHTCEIPPGSLRQLPAPVGILMRAKGDKAGGSRHCTVRIYRAGDYLVIKPGDPSQSGDDCRGAGSRTFCTPNAFWSDLVLNRATQVCRTVK